MIDEPLICTYESILDFNVQIVNNLSQRRRQASAPLMQKGFQDLDQRAAAA